MDTVQMFWIFSIFIAAIAVIGIYCIIATFNLLRALIGLELLIKAVTLLLIISGYLSGRTAVAQAIVITVIVVEVVAMVVAAGLIIGFFKQYDSLNVKNTRSMKG